MTPRALSWTLHSDLVVVHIVISLESFFTRCSSMALMILAACFPRSYRPYLGYELIVFGSTIYAVGASEPVSTVP